MSKTSEYRVEIDEPADRALIEEIESLKEQLTLSKAETSRALGALAAVEGQLKRAVDRAGELKARVFELEGILGDERDAHEEVLAVQQEIGRREGRVL